ncbi:MAG: KEOPS complex subunit Pcc1 [Candidatus Thorarchaeota archaeon]
MTVKIQLQFQSEEEARRTLSAISPDNTPLPEGLLIECLLDNRELTITVKSSRSLDSLAATLEDIMSAIDLSLRASESIN